MDPRYMDNLEKNTFKPCTPTMKKNCEKRGAFLAYWRLISLLSFEKNQVEGRDQFDILYPETNK